jgi:DNA-binding transcriptional ArsR family regulator
MIETGFEHLIEPAAALLKAMGNPQRLRVLYLLAERELSVGQMESLIGLSQSALSQHLAKLRQDKLVRTRRERQTIYYALNGLTALAIMTALARSLRPLRGAANSDDDESACA